MGALESSSEEAGIPVIGCCEIVEKLHEMHRFHHPAALCCKDFHDKEWLVWARHAAENGFKLEVVMGGFKCVMYSVAGKQQRDRHPDSDQFLHTGLAAYALGARWVLAESVCELLTDDIRHKVFSNTVQQLEQLGLVNIACDKLCHNRIKGATKRKRIWPAFEDVAVTALLPPWRSNSGLNYGGNALLSTLHSPETFSDSDLLVGTLVRCEPHLTQDGVLCIGQCHFGGPHSALQVDSRVRVRGHSQVLIVTKIHENKLELFLDNRARPQHYTRFTRADVQSIEWDQAPVYSIYHHGVTIRNFWLGPVGNTFLINDVRIRPDAVRRLRGSEAWAAHRLPKLKLATLQAQGWTDQQVSQLVGNSMPSEMSSLQFKQVKWRVDTTRAIEATTELCSVPWMHGSAPAVDRWKFKLVLLITTTEDNNQCLFLTDKSGQLCIGKCYAHRPPGSLLSTAERWAQTLLESTEVNGMLAANMETNGLETMIALVPVCSRQDCTVGSWRAPADLEPSLKEMASIALHRLQSLGTKPHSLGGLCFVPKFTTDRKWRHVKGKIQGKWKQGVIPATLISAPTKGSGCRTQPWHTLLHALHEHQEELRQRLRDVPTSDPHSTWLHETADCIGPIDVSDFNAKLLEADSDYSDPELSSEPFPEPYQPPDTHWLARSKQAEPPKHFKPTKLSHIFPAPNTRARIERWLKKAMHDIVNYHKYGRDAGRSFNEVLAIGQDEFHPDARGVVWDLREADKGIIKPLSFNPTGNQPVVFDWVDANGDHSVSTHLNLLYLAEQCRTGCLRDYPDQELLSQLFLGVRYKDDLELQLVLLPHLISFADGCKGIQQTKEDQAKLGWYSLHKLLPYAPTRLIPNGSTPKDGDPDNPRETSEAGAPRKVVYDGQRHRVVPQNEAIKGAPGNPKWHKEWKVSLNMFFRAMAILLHVADASKQSISLFSDDIKSCFNQLVLSPEQHHKAVTLMRDGSTSNPLFAAGYILPFGIQCASNLAQGWTHILTHLVRDLMDTMERQHPDPHPIIQEWVTNRQKLFPDQPWQWRLYYDGCFTDDNAAAILGIDRTVRYLRAWHEVTVRFNILMAPPKKRQLGCRMRWIGAIILSTGLATVQLQKRLRAAVMLRTLLAGQLTLSALQKLLGLLQHFVAVFALKQNMMQGMYAPLGGDEVTFGVLKHPEAKAAVSSTMQSVSGKWLVMLGTLAGCSASAFTSERNPITAESLFRSWHSDAANETDLEYDPQSNLGIGLGGYAAGFWWNWALSDSAQRVPIPILEFIAAAVNFFVFGPVFDGFIHEHCRLLLHCDSTPAVLAIIFDAPKALMMQFVRAELGKLSLFRRWEQLIAVSHERGLGNTCADAASRAQVKVLRHFTSAMHIKCIRRKLPPDAEAFIHRSCDYFRSLSALEQGRAVSQAQNADSASNPDWVEVHPAMPFSNTTSLNPGVNINCGSPSVRDDLVLRLDGECTSNRASPLQHSVIGRLRSPPPPAKRPRCVLPSPLLAPSLTEDRTTTMHAVSVVQRVSTQLPHCDSWKQQRKDPPRLAGLKSLTALQRSRQLLLHDVAREAAADIAKHAGAPAGTLAMLNQSNNLCESLSSMFISILDTVPAGTAAKNMQDWEKWHAFTHEHGLSAWRGNVKAHQGFDVSEYWGEQMLQAMAFMSELRCITPRSRNSLAAKPTSVTICSSVRRIHKYFGVTMAAGKVTAALLKSQVLMFIENHGQSGFQC